MNGVGDIRLLVAHYIDRYNREFRKHVRGLQPTAQALLDQYRWPGNVRELRNAIERAMLLADSGLLGVEDFATLSRSDDDGDRSGFRRKASTSRPSSASCWSRRSSAPAATRRRPVICSGSIAIRFGIASRSSV